MTTALVVIGGGALLTAVIKALGPVAFGGRPLPHSFTGVVVLLAPALLAALVVTQAFAESNRLTLGADAVGVAAGGADAWRGHSVIACVTVAACATAGLRAA